VGTFYFQCDVHPNMHGTLTVASAAASPGSTTTTTAASSPGFATTPSTAP
jgi:hypothetical protein